MKPLFCCSNIEPYRPQVLDHEEKFTRFMAWAKDQSVAIHLASHESASSLPGCPFAEWIRYFVPHGCNAFIEVSEQDLIKANFQKVNTQHNLFFDVNIYQEDPVNKHHWRATIARPATNIDLQQCSNSKRDDFASVQGNTRDQ
ncbi:hypothetical protein BJY00DRAFT_322038 [Aspergillus carlsbadensis]|nr:hypothetical protein BJY00DRAFT_322038 [Aspergillus carlsbadensis]